MVQVPHGFDFIIDLHKTDLNPAKPEDRKLYLAACKELNEDKRIQVKNETAKDFKEMAEVDSTKSGCRNLVHKIGNENNVEFSIIRDVRKLKLEDVKASALKIWGDKTADRNTVFSRGCKHGR